MSGPSHAGPPPHPPGTTALSPAVDRSTLSTVPIMSTRGCRHVEPETTGEHVPLMQMSVPLHVDPAVDVAWAHPLAGTHESSVHGLVSLQSGTTGGPEPTVHCSVTPSDANAHT